MAAHNRRRPSAGRAAVAALLACAFLVVLQPTVASPLAVPGPLDGVRFSPASPISVGAGQGVTVSVEAVDAAGTPIPGTTTAVALVGQGGTFNPASGLFTAGPIPGLFTRALKGEATEEGWRVIMEVAAGPGGGGVTLRDVYFTDASNGWVVGDAGAILHTADGGATWAVQPSGTTSTLHGVHFADASNGWAVGDAGTVRRTSNGGATWGAGSSGTTATLRAVHFVDASNGWAAGDAGTMRRTMDAGATWAAQPSGTTNALRGVHFADASNGWAVGDGGTALRTADGGAAWVAQTSGTASVLRGVHFADASNGWAVGDGGIILRTVNAGGTWTPQASGTPNALRGVHFADASNGWAAGDASTLLRTVNGGTAWTVQPSGTVAALHAVFFRDASTGWAVGGGNTILHSADGGLTWALQTGEFAAPVVDFRAVDCVDGATCLAVGLAGGIMRTTDGATWALRPSGVGADLNAVRFADSATAWAVGNAGTALRTTNAGASWQAVSTGSTASFFDVFFVSPSRGWLVGQGGAIVRTTDGGGTWAVQVSGTTADLNGVHFVSATTGWAVGAGGTVLKTTDAGATWVGQPSGTASAFFDVFFADASVGWAAGAGGAIRATRDGGATWLGQASGTSATLRDLSFVDAFNGWAAGDGGTVLHTMDGATWRAQPSGTTGALLGIAFGAASPGHFGYAVGARQLVTKYGRVVSAFADVRVTAGAAARVVIAPDPAEVTMGDRVQFTAAAFDLFNNTVPADFIWSVTNPAAGAIDAAGLFTAGIVTANTTFPGAIRAAVQGSPTVFDTATVTVRVATSIVIPPRVVFPGDLVELPVDMVNINPPGLGSYSIRVLFDPAALRVDAVLPGALGPPTAIVDNALGVVTLSQAGLGAPIGDRRLATLRATAIGPADSESTVRVEANAANEVANVLDVAGGPMRTLSFPARLRIARVDFDASPRAGLAPLPVQFTALVTDNPRDPSWTFFVDTGTPSLDAADRVLAVSTALSPLVTFTDGADISVQFAVTNDAGTRTLTRTAFVRTLKVDFSGSPRTGAAPLEVQFTNLTEGNITSELWSIFRDSGATGAPDGVFDAAVDVLHATSAELNPLIVFAVGADFHVRKQVTGPAGTFAVVKPLFIRTLKVDFDVSPKLASAPVDVQFANLTQGAITGEIWTVYRDDGTATGTLDAADTVFATSTALNPLLTLDEGGDFHVRKQVTGPAGTFAVVKEMLIRTLKVGFSVSPTGGAVPLDVALADLTQGRVTSGLWSVYRDSGPGGVPDGTFDAAVDVLHASSAEPAPVIFISAGADYHVRRQVTGPAGTYALVRERAVRAISADFAIVFTAAGRDFRTRAAPSVPVTFSNLSQGVGLTFLWDFDVPPDGVPDSVDSATASPSTDFTSPGAFRVGLTVLRDEFSATVVKTVTIRQAPVVDFAIGPDRGPAPVDVTLDDLTIGDAPLTFVHRLLLDNGTVPNATDAGDTPVLWQSVAGVFVQATTGADSITVREPVVRFVTGGNYHWQLTATNPLGTDTLVRPVAVQAVRAVKKANGSFTPIIVPIGATVAFDATATEGAVTARLWDFGDGSTSGADAPVHTYAAPGVYDVTLTVTGPAGTSVDLNVDFVTVLGPPVADFVADPTGGVIASPVPVRFTDQSTGDPDTFTLKVFVDTGTTPGALDAGDTLVRFTLVAGAWVQSATGATDTITQRSPLVHFTVGGDYSVQYVVGRTLGGVSSDLLVRANYIHILELVRIVPNATLGALIPPDQTLITIRFRLEFRGTLDPLSVVWDFQNDGTFDSVDAIDPFTLVEYSYTSPRVYSVRARGTGPGGTGAIIASNLITITAPPIAGFTNDPVTPTAGPGPLEVHILDRSLNDPTAWEYSVRRDDGDGVRNLAPEPRTRFDLIAGTPVFDQQLAGAIAIISTAAGHPREPRVRINTGGDYHVEQTVTRDAETGTSVRAVFIRTVKLVLATTPVATAPDDAVHLTPGGTVTFDATASEFGLLPGETFDMLLDLNDDGVFDITREGLTNVSAASQPAVYPGAGNFDTVVLLVTPAGAVEATVRVVVASLLTPSFSATAVAGRSPLSVTLLDLSTGNPARWRWSLRIASPAGDQDAWFVFSGSRFVQVEPGTGGATTAIDGTTGVFRSPPLLLSKSGRYRVTLTVFNATVPAGVAVSVEDAIHVLRAEFIATNTRTGRTADTRSGGPLEIRAGDTVSFEVVTENRPDDRLYTGQFWDLNGRLPYDSSSAAPSFTYTLGVISGRATFNVQLMLTGRRGSALQTVTLNVVP